MKKKLLALAAATVMGLSACSTGSTTTTTSDGSSSTESAQTSNTGTEAETSGEVTTIKWISVGGGTPTNFDAWLEIVNPYLEEKIGVNLEAEIVSWGDWSNRRNIIVSSGEYFDILFTNDEKYVSEVNLGAFMEISDLLQTTGSELYNFIPEDIWEAVKVNDGIYAVPAYKDSTMTNFWRWDADIIENYNIDIESNTTLESLTPILKEITDGEGTFCVQLDNDNGLNIIPNYYDTIGLGSKLIGVKYDDEDRKVSFIFDDEEILGYMDTIHEWYEYGIINQDAASTTDTQDNLKLVSIAQGWLSAWVTDGYLTAQFGDTILSNTTVQGSMLGIYAGSSNAEKALELIQLVNMDTYLRDLFYYGVPGDDWDYVDVNGEQRVDQRNTNWTWSGYTQANFFTLTPLSTVDTNVYETEVAVQNANATPSVMLGFSLDTSGLETQIASVSSIWEKYKAELMTGTQEPRAYIADMKAELEAAGMNELIEAIQAQVDAHFAG